jgi:hypothetical protein
MRENVYLYLIHIFCHCHKTRKLILRRLQELKAPKAASEAGLAISGRSKPQKERAKRAP